MKTICIILTLLRENFDTWKIFKKTNVGQFWLDVVFRQIEIVLKDSTAFVYVTQSEKSSH